MRNWFQQISRNCFQFIEVLFLSIEDDVEYLDAKRWEKLIPSNMYNLRIFDMHHNNIRPAQVDQNGIVYGPFSVTLRCRIPRQYGPYFCARYYDGNTVLKVTV